MLVLITVLQVLACLLIVTCVLLQPAKGGGAVLGGTSQSVFGSTGGTTFLFRVTMWAAVFLMLSSLFVGWYKVREGRQSVVDMTAPVAPAPAAPAPAAPAQPAK